MNLEKFINIIHAETGIDSSTIGEYSYVSAIQTCMKKCGLDDAVDYLHLLESSRNEISNLIEEIIVPETWFFRDEYAFDALLTELNKKTGNTSNFPLRILSLPSSTGEEAYSIAIRLFENGYTSQMFTIDAIDISQRNIDAARIGQYRQHSFRNKLSDLIMQKYFTAHDDIYEISDKVKQAVTFTRGNLFNFDTLATHQYYDAIFCRNLFIYFSSTQKKTAFRKISAALKDKGILLIGHSETSIIPTKYYAQCSTVRSFGFIKSIKPIKASNAIPDRKPVLPMQQVKHNNNMRAVTRDPAKQTQPPKTIAPEKNDITLPTTTLKQATKLADRGQFDEALKIGLSVSNTDSTAECFTLLGAIYSAQNHNKAAEKYFRKALFLDPNYHEALVHLALLLKKRGDLKNAELFRTRAQKCQPQIKRAAHTGD